MTGRAIACALTMAGCTGAQLRGGPPRSAIVIIEAGPAELASDVSEGLREAGWRPAPAPPALIEELLKCRGLPAACRQDGAGSAKDDTVVVLRAVRTRSGWHADLEEVSRVRGLVDRIEADCTRCQAAAGPWLRDAARTLAESDGQRPPADDLGAGAFRLGDAGVLRGIGEAKGIRNSALRTAVATQSARADLAKLLRTLVAGVTKRYDPLPDEPPRDPAAIIAIEKPIGLAVPIHRRTVVEPPAEVVTLELDFDELVRAWEGALSPAELDALRSWFAEAARASK